MTLLNKLKSVICIFVSLLLRVFVRPSCSTVYFTSYPDYSDNAKVLYEYILDTGKNKDYRFYWYVKGNVASVRNCNNLTVVHGRIHNIYSIYRSKYIFYTHAFEDIIWPRRDQVVVNLWHGCGYKATGLTVSEDNRTLKDYYRLKKSKFDYVLVPGEIFVDKKSSAFGCAKEKVLPIGYARYNILINSMHELNDAKKRAINELVAGTSVDDKFVIWMPTYRKKQSGTNNSKYYKLPIFGDDYITLDSLCKKYHIRMLIKIHKNEVLIEQDKIGTSIQNIVFVDDKMLQEKDLDIYEVLGQSNALISDYSSVAVDYLLTDRPIAFTIDDIETYRTNPGFIFDDPLAYMPGWHISTIDQMEEHLRCIRDDEDIFKDTRLEMKKKMHCLREDYCKPVLELVGML